MCVCVCADGFVFPIIETTTFGIMGAYNLNLHICSASLNVLNTYRRDCLFIFFNINFNKVRTVCVSQIKQKQNATTKVQDKPNSELLDPKFPLMHFSSAKVGKNSLQTATENYHVIHT